MILIGRLNSAHPTAAQGYEVNAIAASVIGGASLMGAWELPMGRSSVLLL